MIIGIGIDAVAINRFASWHCFSRNQLSKIFTLYELDYCLDNPLKAAERFAVRFSAKEACYKALSGFLGQKSLWHCARYIGVEHTADRKPTMVLDWKKLCMSGRALFCERTSKVHVSLTHTQEIAIAYVIVESI